jgi:hypothetical protein
VPEGKKRGRWEDMKLRGWEGERVRKAEERKVGEKKGELTPEH